MSYVATVVGFVRSVCITSILQLHTHSFIVDFSIVSIACVLDHHVAVGFMRIVIFVAACVDINNGQLFHKINQIQVYFFFTCSSF